MRIYLLSLPDDEQRRAALRDRFPEHFPRFQLVPAIDGRNGLPTPGMRICRRNRNRPLSSTEIACALGHLDIYGRILEEAAENNAFSLVIEDDVIGTTEDLRRIERLAAALPRNSMAILGGQQGMARARHLHGYATSWEGVYRIPASQLRNLARTCCYLLDKDTAILLMRQQSSCLTRADDWAGLLAKHQHVYFTPILSHPFPNRFNSHIDVSRSKLYSGGILARWHRDGLRESIARPFARNLTPLFGPLVGLKRIP